jgi:hypothetical protein
VVAGALMAIGIVNCCVQNENDPGARRRSGSGAARRFGGRPAAGSQVAAPC